MDNHVEVPTGRLEAKTVQPVIAACHEGEYAL